MHEKKKPITTEDIKLSKAGQESHHPIIAMLKRHGAVRTGCISNVKVAELAIDLDEDAHSL